MGNHWQESRTIHQGQLKLLITADVLVIATLIYWPRLSLIKLHANPSPDAR
jgi:hypothetical protein